MLSTSIELSYIYKLYTGKMWKDHGMLPQLEALHENIEILSIQTTELNDVECIYYTALVRGV